MQEVLKLRLGKMTTQELAKWMGISYSQFRKKKKEDRFKQLSNFCNFREVYGGVQILEIFEEEYSKQMGTNKQIIIDNINDVWSSDGIDTCRRVGEEIKMNYNLPIAAKTASIYAAAGRNLMFGNPYEINGSGKLGSCSFVWCKKEGDGVNAKYSRLTPEEEKIKEDLSKKYFGNVDEKVVIVKAMVEAGEIKKEEAWDVLEELTHMNKKDNYFGFLLELQATLQCKLVRATDVVRYSIESAF